MHVLLIEPDRVVGQTTQAALEAAGCSVVWVRSGQKAVDAMEAQLPDIIVVEIQLGLHNGIEMLYEIRSYPEWQQIPVIIYTLNAKLLDRTLLPALRQVGVGQVLYKPRVSTKELLVAVQAYAGKTA